MNNMNNDLLRKALNLGGLVSYQDGSVVSRTIIKKGTGNVTVFAFDAGQGLSEHTAPFDAMVVITDGEARITISGETLTAKNGDMVIMPADEPHSLFADKRFKMTLIMIKE